MSKTKPVLCFFDQVLSCDLNQIKVRKTSRNNGGCYHIRIFMPPPPRMGRHCYAPPPESGGVLCYTLRNFECPSVRPSVRPSVSAHHHSCIGNSSYSFRPILLKLYRCFKDGLKICILFFQNPEIIFYHFFPIFNLRHFSSPYTTDMYMEYVPCIGNSSYSFWRILLKLYRCFKDGLKICILFFQNPEIIFYHFFLAFLT